MNESTPSNPSWFVNINTVKTDYVVIENLEQFLSPPVPKVHPNHPDYRLFWSKETKKCIEGIWGNEWGKYRFMPGNLYFLNYTVLEHTKQNEATDYFKPSIVDYYWDFAYMSLVTRGFSGFDKDEKYSSNKKLKDYLDKKIDKKYLHSTCYNSEGNLKEYVEPFAYLSQLHEEPLGKPMFYNETIDNMILGSRGGGKSYYTALAELEYRFVFNNVKSYKEFIDPRKRKLSKQCVGSGETTKSADLLAKVKVSQDAKTRTDNAYFREIFGVWGKDEEDPDFKPCPFYRKTLGNFDCPNKRNPYRNEYKVLINGEWKPRGSGSAIFHVNYNSKKGKGAQAATGGRYDFMDYEEVGEMDNYVEAKGSNENCVKRGIRFGVQWAQGTSGNIEYIMGTKEVFLNPQDYNLLSFPNKNGVEGKNGRTAYFLPNYMVLFHFKDKNGNTDFEAAIRQVNEERQTASESKDPKVLTAKLMNEPCYTHEMWLTDKGYYLPYEEAAVREKELMTNNLYKTNHVPVELYWDTAERYGVGYKILHNAEPHINFPVPKDMKDPSGCICIYEFPTPNEQGVIPNDMYMFIGYDNYVEQNLDYGGSLGVTYILKNPKYIPQGYTGNIIVASYIGKPAKGLDYYHEQQEKLLAMYGEPVRGLWFEKNRGEPVREYYIRKHKTHLLCLTPQRVLSSNIYQQNMASYGFIVGNKIAKINLLKLVHDWLLEETTFEINGKTETKKNIQRIPCLFLLRQIMQYDLDGNFDAVSALIGCVLGLREYQNELEDKANLKSKNKVNIFAGLLKNNKIYRNAGFAQKG